MQIKSTRVRPRHICSITNMTLDRIDFRTAESFFLAFEHLGNCGLGVWHWGAVEDGHLVGAVSFGTTCFARSRGAIASVATRFGLGLYQICRGGTVHTAPRNTPSRILSGCMSALRRERGDCIIVAYSDRAYNEVGTIYQACNALYTGQTNPKNQSNYIISGKVISGWLVRKRYGTRAIEHLKRIDPGVVKIPLTPKYRYLFVQTSRQTKGRVLAALQPFIMPYPNRTEENIKPMNVAALVKQRTRQSDLCLVNGVVAFPASHAVKLIGGR
jgi:hypothetical protein